MKFPLYAVRDSLIGFSMPVIRDNDAVASRAFEYDYDRDDSPYKNHPEHFQLFHIGEYDTDDGTIVGCSPRMVTACTDFIVNKVKE